jgi:hypothetical protein
MRTLEEGSYEYDVGVVRNSIESGVVVKLNEFDPVVYPVDAVTVKLVIPVVEVAGVPVNKPLGVMLTPEGSPDAEYETTCRPLNVVAVIWTGVMALFWIQVSVAIVGNVKTSSITAKFTLRVFVAGVDTALAVTASVWRGVIAVGVPVIVAVFPLVDKLNPVPARAGADQDRLLPDAAAAENWMGVG